MVPYDHFSSLSFDSAKSKCVLISGDGIYHHIDSSFLSSLLKLLKIGHSSISDFVEIFHASEVLYITIADVTSDAIQAMLDLLCQGVCLIICLIAICSYCNAQILNIKSGNFIVKRTIRKSF